MRPESILSIEDDGVTDSASLAFILDSNDGSGIRISSETPW
jgi:hypothetical protein